MSTVHVYSRPIAYSVSPRTKHCTRPPRDTLGSTQLFVRVMSLPASFQWPWQYDFPPFFTVQPNTDTRRKQLEAWCDLVLAYHRATKTYLLDVNEAQSSPLFCNSKINSILVFVCYKYVHIHVSYCIIWYSLSVVIIHGYLCTDA